MERATKVACISSTESSTEVPKPSFRISTPNNFAEAAAPYSLAAAMVMSKGRIWSVYQGWAISLKPCTSDKGIESSCSVMALMGTATSRVRVELCLTDFPYEYILTLSEQFFPLSAPPTCSDQSSAPRASPAERR
jgi:hypothetical protein